MTKKKIKIAIISDIHGNAQALSEVVSDINDSATDCIICLGDIATLGPSPNETIEILRDLDCPCILGNHEEALFSPEKSAEFDLKGEMLSDTIYWCLEKLTPSNIRYLKKSVTSLSLKLPNNKTMLCYHGSVNSTIDSITPDTPEEQLDSLIDFNDTLGLAVGGHTHFQMLRKYKDVLIVNPGSVGCAFTVPSFTPPAPSFNPLAEYAIIECTEKKISVDLKSLDYDVAKFVSLVRHSDSPLKVWWEEEFFRLGL